MRLTLMILILFFFSSIKGQSQSIIPKERVQLTVDRNIYFDDEGIRFGAMVQMKDSKWLPSISKTLYVDLLNKNGFVVARTKSAIENGKSEGVVVLGQAIKTGDYFLRGYTRYQRNIDQEKINYISIRVVNVEIPTDEKPSISKSNQECQSRKLVDVKKQINEKMLELICKPTGIEKLTYRIVGKGLTKAKKIHSTTLSSRSLMKPEIPFEGLPDILGLTLSGLIQKKDSTAEVDDILVSATVTGKYHQVHFTRTNQEGLFRFSLPQTSGVQEIILCAIGNNETINLLIHDDFNFPFKEIELQPDTSEWNGKLLQQAYVNHQISEEIFSNHVVAPDESLDTPPIPLSSPTSNIKLADYVALNSMQQVLKEIVTNCYVRKTDERLYLKIINPKNQTSYNQPLLMIDHLPVKRLDDILALDLKDVESIDVFAEEFVMGGEIIKACLNINTPSKSALSFKIPDHCKVLEFNTLEKRNSTLHNISNVANTLTFIPFQDEGKTVSIKLPVDLKLENYVLIVTGVGEMGECFYQETPLN